MVSDTLDSRIDAIGSHRFRAKFHLRGREAALVQLRGREAIRRHAHELIAKRLAPSRSGQGRQADALSRAPGLRGPARHRDLLPDLPERWHGIAKGRELSGPEREYVVDVICRWIDREVDAPR